MKLKSLTTKYKVIENKKRNGSTYYEVYKRHLNSPVYNFFAIFFSGTRYTTTGFTYPSIAECRQCIRKRIAEDDASYWATTISTRTVKIV